MDAIQTTEVMALGAMIGIVLAEACLVSTAMSVLDCFIGGE